VTRPEPLRLPVLLNATGPLRSSCHLLADRSSVRSGARRRGLTSPAAVPTGGGGSSGSGVSAREGR